MIRRASHTASVIALAAYLSATHAQAQASPNSPAGRWAFKTDTVSENCILQGEMQIRPTSTPDRYTCRFIANQYCEGESPLDIEVEQTCSADLSGVQLNIESEIARVVSVSPEFERDRVEALYAPDHFFVSLDEAGDEMTGMFHSVSRAFVRFTRLPDLTS